MFLHVVTDDETGMTMAEPVQDPTALLHRISSKLPYLPRALRAIGERILNDPGAVQTMSITQLAMACDVAESSVSRFVREIGLDSYQSLRLALAEATFVSRAQDRKSAEPESGVYDGIARDDPIESIVGKIERSSQRAIRQTARRQNAAAVETAVSLIEAANTLVFCCMGSSSIAAEEGVMRFTRAGKKCLLFRDQSVQVMLASVLGPGDLLIGISNSGQSAPIIQSLRLAREHGARTIGVTSAEGAPITAHCDVTLYTSSVPNGGAHYGEAMTSKWGQLLVIDVLYAAYAARHFDDTLAHLEETYREAIRQSRVDAPAGRP